LLLVDGKSNGEDKKFIVAADLHVGSETYGAKNEVNLNPEILSQNVNGTLLKLVKLSNANGIILLGDLKSNISGLTRLERNSISILLATLSRNTEVYLIPGNHDSFIKYITSGTINLISPSGMVLGDILFIHGHTMPSPLRSSVSRIIMGHVHPVFLKPNNIVNGQRVWVYLKVRKQSVFPNSGGVLQIVIMPSFYDGTRILHRHSQRRVISPILDRLLKDHAIIEMLCLTLDGSIVADLLSEDDIPL
jgi:uncharacterized protein